MNGSLPLILGADTVQLAVGAQPYLVLRIEPAVRMAVSLEPSADADLNLAAAAAAQLTVLPGLRPRLAVEPAAAATLTFG